MLLSLNEMVAKYVSRISGIIHCGARIGEEADSYDAIGVKNVWWIEGNPNIIPKLTSNVSKYNHTVIHALLYEKDGEELTFNITNYDGMSSSILEFGTHPEFSPDTVFVDHVSLLSRSLDSLVKEYKIKANLLNMDLQGAELLCLKGAENLIPKLDYIFTEVNNAQVYKGCAQISELDSLLSDFQRVETYWVPGQGWGDALYVRKGLL